MGMKSNSGHFTGTNGYKRSLLPLNIQLFANKPMSKTGERLLKKANDSKLKNVIKELYRGGATVGDGGTAAALKHEIKTGKLVGGKSHIIKAKERAVNLERILKRNDLSKRDRKIAQKLYKDLLKVLKLGGY